MVLVWILLLLGFILLIKGADYFVEGSSSVAKALRIPGVVIGLTVVAMGTSAPELAVSVTAALTGNNDIAVGNVIGSNIFNILLVLGVAGAVSPMEVLMENLIDDIILIGMSSIVWVFAWRRKQISRIHGALMLAMYAGYTAYICMR